MKYLKIKDDLKISRIAFGCMRIAELKIEELETLVKVALQEGINFFDHADIYGGGKSEEMFGEVLKRHPEYREKMIIQTKCGIRHGKVNYYDFSKEHILQSVETSLKRLNTDYIDVLLLHRPDTLMEPHEVAQAFCELQNSGKVHHFGVSNMNPTQIALLQKELNQRVMFNQIQFSPATSGIVTNGLFVNCNQEEALDHDGSLLEYCRLKDITIQPWSILQQPNWKGTFLDSEEYLELNETLQEYADQYNVTKTAIVMAWILRHPAKMQPIFGTTKPEHIKEMCKGMDIELSREDWYYIYTKGLGTLLP